MLDSSIVSELYGTADSPTKWSSILDRLHPIVNAKGAGLIVVDRYSEENGPPNQFGVTSSSLPLDKMAIYNTEYAKYEREIVAIGERTPVGQMVVDPAFKDRETISNRPDVAFCIENFGIRDRFGVRLNDDKAWYDVLAFQYDTSRGNATKEEFSKVVPYISHVAQSVTQGRIFDQIRKRYGAVLSMLDRVNIGMMLLRSDATVLIMNECSKEIFDRSPFLSVTANRKISLRSSENSRLLHEIADLGKSHSSENPKRHIYLKDDLLVELSPLCDTQGDIEKSFLGVMALFIDPKSPIAINEKGITQVYDLTNAELDVTKSIGIGRSIVEVAEDRNSSPETVKKQLKSIYQKTASSSQADLVRRIISISLPFRD